ncbi:serine/threonine protein kinase [Mycobacterium xenopi RIVM700367]|uniref:non-specific serine/threonine protein kinase n=1 Tax=Mycobacterium xenopi TaxID=1789 RepID=A0AAD1H064_MYCXE|nr:protein kinase [Mycobacterium xenopi]EID17867.1 serine/threonine protein kinase [Mycobacterium xenopi RIVM700367]ORX20955.1 serine/threonine protein kinase [Mycobacterium xenopi]BBU22383.1 serine/threonine-protein kinase PknL [Mycobacterium xenopi]SPX78259.1 Ser/Thr protein kinase L [Mycobacterium xenopi]
MAAAISGNALDNALLDGRYRVQAKIASGGTSTVYRGLDERLDRPVALKVMDARYAGDQQFLTRFRLEARAVARLKHPGLVAVYDQGLDARHPFLVMELIEGGTLRELLVERGPMPPHAVVAVLRPVLGGLAVAHRAGLVHRDVKPENVLISDDGEVKIADFGLVRAVAAAKITSASVILGTAAYLSPEQVRDGDATASSDVYAVGILVYEMLTGRTPFSGDSPLAVAYQRLDADVPRPSTAIDGVPPQFDELVARATARDPADRYADALQLGAELDAIAAELALPEFRVPAPRNSAQHRSAALYHSQIQQEQVGGHTRQTTRKLTREMPADEDPVDYQAVSGQFAGIELSEFALARQHAQRMVLVWLAIVLAVTGLVAAAAWTIGSNLNGLL